MLNALDNSWRIDEVSFPFTVELSVYRGFTVGCFGCPNLISGTRMGHACCTVIAVRFDGEFVLVHYLL